MEASEKQRKDEHNQLARLFELKPLNSSYVKP